jgi:hypothetical protein
LVRALAEQEGSEQVLRHQLAAAAASTQEQVLLSAEAEV